MHSDDRSMSVFSGILVLTIILLLLYGLQII